MTEPAEMSTGGAQGGRDAAVLRRARRVSGAAAMLVGGLLLARVLVLGAGGAAGAMAVLAGLGAGAIVAAAWLLLAGLLDLVANVLPSRRRMVWTVAASGAAVALPVLILAAQGAG